MEFSDGISLAVGQPDFSTPEAVKLAGVEALTRGHTRYTVNAGLPALREAVSMHMLSAYGAYYNPVNEILVTSGASQALDVALRTILEPGDQVVLASPGYSGYEPLIHMAGGTVVPVDVSRTGFELTPGALEASLTSRTKCVILPCANPSGLGVRRANLVSLVDALKRCDCFVLSDELYADMCFDSDGVSLAEIEALLPRALIIRGLSKTHSMTGLRIGFLLGPCAVVQECLKVHQYSATCASSVSQYAAVAAFDGYVQHTRRVVESYRHRREMVHSELRSFGMTCPPTDSGFFVFPSVASMGYTSDEFASALLEEKHVAVVPGSAFGPFGEGFARLSFALPEGTLREALSRIGRFVA